MIVREVVQLEDGRNLILNLTEKEYNYLLSFAVNNLIAMGMMTVKEDAVQKEEPAIIIEGSKDA